MIKNQNRAGWFGASDTARIMGNWNTPTFARWWLEKLGMVRGHFTTPSMQTGTAYEHKILRAAGITKMDRTVYKPLLRLRVNLDGEDAEIVHEVKTYSTEKFCVCAAYWMQCQVEMYATGKACEIIAYRLMPNDYENYFNEIDLQRISRHPIPCDVRWVQNEYLPRLRYLARCLRRRVTPNECEFSTAQQAAR